MYINVNECVVCSAEFETDRISKRYCGERCVRAATDNPNFSKLDPINKGRKWVNTKPVEMPKGSYVYGWFQKSTGQPFYIGLGAGERAWRKDEPTPAGKRRAELGADVETRIIRDNLTPEGAALIEAVLIDLLREMNVDLYNICKGMTRQERLPLTLT